jgi:hypothetical protein
MAVLTLTEVIIFTFVVIGLVLWLVEYGYIAFVRHARREPPTSETVATIRSRIRRRVDDEKRAANASAVAPPPKRCAPPHVVPVNLPDLEAPPTSSPIDRVPNPVSQRWTPSPSRGPVVNCLPTITEEESSNMAPHESPLVSRAFIVAHPACEGNRRGGLSDDTVT